MTTTAASEKVGTRAGLCLKLLPLILLPVSYLRGLSGGNCSMSVLTVGKAILLIHKKCSPMSSDYSYFLNISLFALPYDELFIFLSSIYRTKIVSVLMKSYNNNYY